MRRGRWFLGASLVAVGAVAALASGVAGGPPGGLYRLAGLFGQIVAMVRSSYVEEVSVDRLEQGAMTALVAAGDPGGAWVAEGQFPAFLEIATRPLPAFGVVLGLRSSYPVVLQVVPGSPAERSGLVRGELLESVAGEVLRAQPLWRAELRLAEAERRGEQVTLQVIDRFLRGKRAVVLAPGEVRVASPAVEDRTNVVVVRPTAVAGEGARQLREVLNGLGQRVGVVVDLRGVVLGDRQGAVELAAAVAGGEVEVPLARRGGAGGSLKARGPNRSWKVVVCIDATTARAGEVAAVALKRAGATLIGGQSYGDTGERQAVSVQGGKLWLATTWCLGPDGKGLIGHGLVPDEVVRMREGEDPVLARALEIAGAGTTRQAA